MCLDFFDKINKVETKENIEAFILYNVSPVLSEVKPSITLNFQNKSIFNYNMWKTYGEKFVNSIGLDFTVLRETDDLSIILIYNESLIEQLIKRKDIAAFLNNIGYENANNVDKYLSILKERYERYNCPHELGIFLGIPLDDVNDFIKCSEKKCLTCGYWKVFNNYDFAINKFKQYDDIKMITAEKILQGMKITNIISSIKTNFVV